MGSKLGWFTVYLTNVFLTKFEGPIWPGKSHDHVNPKHLWKLWFRWLLTYSFAHASLKIYFQFTRKKSQNPWTTQVKTKTYALIWESYQKWSTLHIFWITIDHVICYFWRIVNWSSIFGWVEITLGLLNFRCWNILRLFMFVLDVFWIEDDPAHDGNSNIVVWFNAKEFLFRQNSSKNK